MSILEEAKKYGEAQQKKLEEELAGLPTEQIHREELAQILDECLEGMTPRYTYIGWRFEIKFDTVDKAREFVSKVLDKLATDKVDKEFEGWYATPFWRYVVSYQNLTLRVEPADADEGCKPIPKASASTYWVCERK